VNATVKDHGVKVGTFDCDRKYVITEKWELFTH
jgi:hypothetical protein